MNNYWIHPILNLSFKEWVKQVYIKTTKPIYKNRIDLKVDDVIYDDDEWVYIQREVTKSLIALYGLNNRHGSQSKYQTSLEQVEYLYIGTKSNLLTEFKKI